LGPHPGDVLIPSGEIAARVRALGHTIAGHYAGREPLLVGVLKGAVVFAADLARAIPIPLGLDFIGVSSYGARTRSSGAVKITADLSVSIEGRDVLLVEDIVDTGRTLAYLRRNLATRHPRSLAACALLDKVARREVEVAVDYVGFAIPDRFVVGYGFDLGGLYRGLPDIRVLEGAPPR
jgi:hypoxanthine phosphoribosyltransferase